MCSRPRKPGSLGKPWSDPAADPAADMRAVVASRGERCELTGLFVSECACKEHRGAPTPVASMVIVTTFRARYDGGCAASNEHRIKKDDLVGWTEDDVVVCSACVEANR